MQIKQVFSAHGRNGNTTQPILGAALMNIATLVALLWVHWRSVNLVGA